MTSPSKTYPFYFTFGQSHRHEVNDKVFDKDCVAVLRDTNYGAARERFWQMFGDTFHGQTVTPPPMNFYPRGLIEVEDQNDNSN